MNGMPVVPSGQSESSPSDRMKCKSRTFGAQDDISTKISSLTESGCLGVTSRAIRSSPDAC